MGAAALAHDAAAGQSHLRIENCVWQVSILTPYDTGTRHNRARGVRSYGDATGSPHAASDARYGRQGWSNCFSPFRYLDSQCVILSSDLDELLPTSRPDISSSIWAKNIFSFT